MTHLATGRLILEGTFPRVDLYSFSADGAPWVVQSWLASVAYAGAERLAGSDGIHLLVAAISAALGCVIYALSRPAEQLLSRLLVAGSCMMVSAFGWSERPLVFGLLGLGLVLLAVENRLHPAWLVPVMWVWANSHGSYPLAVVACLAFALGRRLDGDHPREELRVVLFVAIGIIAAVVGPLGLHVLTFPFELLGRAELLSYISEWKAPAFDGTWTRLFLLLVILGMFGLARRPTFRAAVPFITFVTMALISSRNIAPAAIVFVPCLSVCWAGLGSIRGDRRSVPAAAGLVAIVVCGLLLVQQRWVAPGWDFQIYPLRSLDYAIDHGWTGSDVRLVTEDFVGNLREGMDGRDANVFFDDRMDMFPRPVVDDYLSLVFVAPDWAAVLDRNEVDAVIWSRDEPLSSVLVESTDWQVVFQEESFVVVCRRGSVVCEMAA